MDKENDSEYLLKIVFVGNSNVGKSSIIRRFIDGTFDKLYMSTIGVDFRLKTIIFNKKIFKLQIWDTAGQERFRTFTSAYYRGSHAIVIVFDITNKDSFQDLDHWMDEIKKCINCDDRVYSVPIILVGNKSDITTREISNYEAINYAIINKCTYIETSAKDDINIQNIFSNLINSIITDQYFLNTYFNNSASKINNYTYNDYKNIHKKSKKINDSCKC